MFRIRLLILIVPFLTTGIASTSADVIRSSNTPASEPVTPQLALEQPALTSVSGAATKVAEDQGWEAIGKSPLPVSADLAAAALRSDALAADVPSLKNVAAPAAVSLVGTDFGYSDPEIASDAHGEHNVRIPEPASLTLVGVGIFGLVVSVTFRRKLHASRRAAGSE